jgi:iron complex transport system substrate-binding protein
MEQVVLGLARLSGLLGSLLAALAWTTRADAAPAVFSLDQCADQYVLALAPRADIAGLSYRADDADSYLRDAARGLPLRRASLESVLAARPQVVVRYWGGDDLMARRLAGRGVEVVKIDDANDFEAVRANVRRVAAALGRRDQGEALIVRMDRELAAARGAWRGKRALYLTPGGFTAGRETLVGAMMSAAGLVNAASSPGFAPVSLERLTADPPDGFVLGFFDRTSMQTEHWSMGRRGALRRITDGRTLATLPAAILGCPAWFAADGARDLAQRAPGRQRP